MLQYIANLASEKDLAREFRRHNVTGHRTWYCRCEETWENVVYLTTHGYTIARVGATTSFIFLDIDESDVTHEELAEKLSDWKDTLVLKGTSGLWYKHHIIIRTDPITIRPADEGPRIAQAPFREAVRDAFARVQALFPGRKLKLDDHSEYYWQCLYSYCEVDDPDPQECPIPGSLRLKGWITQYKEGEEYKGSPRCFPLNQWTLNRMFHREARPDIVRIDWNAYWFDASGRHRHSIKVGSRTKAEYPLIVAATYFARYCNSHYGADYGKEDVIYTVKSIITAQFAEGGAHYSERSTDICMCIGREWFASGAIDINAYALNRLPGAKIGYKPQNLDAKALWGEFKEQIIAEGDNAIDFIYRIAEGDVATAKSLINRYKFTLRSSGKAATSRLSASDYQSIVANATPDANGRLLLPKKLCHNPNFRKFLASRGIAKCRWI